MTTQCERSIIVPERAPGEPVDATMLLDCAEWKANGSVFVDLSKSAPMVVPEG